MSDTGRTDQSQPLPRREFLRGAAIAAAGMTIVPRHVLGGQGFTAPSDLVNIAGVGIGGMGRSNLTALSSQNIVALCDVDWGYVERGYGNIPEQVANITRRLKEAPASATAEQRAGAERQIAGLKQLHEKYQKAARYTDFREMLEKQKDIDGVMVATPDHTHAVVALAAMSLGKHVYVQKPLAWSVEECRMLGKKAADNPKLATQMGNQGHSSDGARLVNEIVAAKLIGDISEVHVWTNRPVTHWPQGIPRPAPGIDTTDLQWNLTGVMKRLAAAMGKYPVPDKLNWDLFLGPAPQAEYHPVYHPFNWRGWTDWGVGAIGDMGAHLIDHPFWALDLGFPTSVETQSTPYTRASADDPGPRTYPLSTTTYYTFPAKNGRPAVRLTWYDGGLLPPKPAELGEEELNKGGGVLYIGSKGKLLHDNYGGNPRLLPQSANDAMQKPPELFERITTSHELNWVGAIKGENKASSPFSYAAPLTETMLLGVVALNAGKRIDYDGANMRITNAPEANQFLKREYRQGWSLT